MANVQPFWWVGLTVILALFYAATGALTGGSIAVVAILGAVLIGSALALRMRSKLAASALLVLGALPLGILTWWSLVTPVLAILTIICGVFAIRPVGKTSNPRLQGFARRPTYKKA